MITLMPKSKRSPCSFPTCMRLTYESRCDLHKTKRQYRPKTGEAAKRHSMYNNRIWRSMRKVKLLNEPLCAECERRGITKLANVVDHIIPHRGNHALFQDETNLQSLCKKCHDKKTARGE